MAGVQVPAAVVVGERAPGIPGDPVQSGRRVRPAAPAVGLPVVFDLGLPGLAILDVDPVAVAGQRGAVAVGIDRRIGREAGSVPIRPLVQCRGGGAGSVLELDPGVVESLHPERFATADDHRTPLRDDLGEPFQDRDFGPGVAVAFDLVAALLLGVDPGIRRVDGGQLGIHEVVRDFQAQAAAVQNVEGVHVVGIRRAGDLGEGDFAVMIEGEDRAVGHQHGQAAVGSRPDPVPAQDREMDLQLALRTRAGSEQGRLAVQRADEAVDALEFCLFLLHRLLGLRRNCGAGRDNDQQDLREGGSHLVSSNRVGVCTLPPGRRLPGPAWPDLGAGVVRQN